MNNKIYKTKDESQKAYKEYIDNHIKYVQKAGNLYFDIIWDLVCKRPSASGLNKSIFKEQLMANLQNHDRSKYGIFEFQQYAAKFYPCDADIKKPECVKEEFNKAWEHHYKLNHHHPEAWVFDMDGQKTISSMTNLSFAEMICDWIGISLTHGSSVADWWDNNPGGAKEKKELLTPIDFDLVNRFIHMNSDLFDYRSK